MNPKQIEELSKRKSIKEFILEKKPTGIYQIGIAIGYYLEKKLKMSSFTHKDLEQGFRDAKEPLPRNLSDLVYKNVKNGWFMELKEQKNNAKSWVLTSSGERLVENNFEKTNEHPIFNYEREKGIDLLKKRGIHSIIIQVSDKLFSNGHYSQAIFEAFKAVNLQVKKKSGLSHLDGKNLMSQAFKLSSPRLRWTDLKTDSDNDEQEGFMFLYMGAIVGIRNPKAHDHIILKDEIIALEYLSFASLLMKRIDEAIVDKST